jgi:VCBS repeat-containing protein
MATFTATAGITNVANAQTGELEGFTGGTLAELQDEAGDLFIGSDGSDLIVAGPGGDTIIGGPGADYMLGTAGPDLFIYNEGDAVAGEVANGATGLDTIQASGSLDFTECDIDHFGTLQTTDDGADISILNSQTGGSGFTNFLGGGGFDRLTVYMSPFDSFESMSNDSVVDFIVFGFESIRIIDGVGADNLIRGSTSDDLILGGKGQDTISGREGNDTIVGGDGSDSLNGGVGTADVVRFAGELSRYSISGPDEGNYIVIDNLGNGGADTIRNFQFVEFDDGVFATYDLANTLATIAGTDSGGVREDSIGSATGQLTVSDPDSGQESFQTTPLIAAKYGVFTIDASGHWTYELNNALAAVQKLGDGQTILDTIRIVSFDNTAHDITITIHGQSELIKDPAGNAAGLVKGTAGADIIMGLGGNDTLQGLRGSDTIWGGSGHDELLGGWGNDVLIGQGGADLLIGNGGADRFDFNKLSDSRSAAPDTISDFGTGADRIDLSDIDASKSLAENQSFAFIGKAAFSAEGQVRVVQSGADAVILVNTSGNSGAEMKIVLSGVSITAISESDFIL